MCECEVKLPQLVRSRCIGKLKVPSAIYRYRYCHSPTFVCLFARYAHSFISLVGRAHENSPTEDERGVPGLLRLLPVYLSDIYFYICDLFPHKHVHNYREESAGKATR
jgi:hypothetical protein